MPRHISCHRWGKHTFPGYATPPHIIAVDCCRSPVPPHTTGFIRYLYYSSLRRRYAHSRQQALEISFHGQPHEIEYGYRLIRRRQLPLRLILRAVHRHATLHSCFRHCESYACFFTFTCRHNITARHHMLRQPHSAVYTRIRLPSLCYIHYTGCRRRRHATTYVTRG